MKKSEMQGFTLVELLVVISIIALLMGLLMPALNMARKQAYKIVCGSNLRQQVLGLTMYAGDNNDFVPHITSGNWLWDIPFSVTDSILKYTGKSRKIFYCPSNKWISEKRTGIWYWSLNKGEFYPEESYKKIDKGLTKAQRERNFRIIGYTWLINRDGTSSQSWKPILDLGPPIKRTEWIKRLSEASGDHRSPATVELAVDTIISTKTGRHNKATEWKVWGGTGMLWGWASPSNHLSGDKVDGESVGFCDGSVVWRKFEKMDYRNTNGPPYFWW